METTILVLFFVIFGVFCLYAKKHLYAHEHEESIGDNLKTFDNNIKEMDNLEKESNY
ncbi:hypothetical protein [Seonamhaeicola marinus]|uniref:hypothetical protein n=1 Tax=Seonamhaeicola marinus TaxID=1912246 RepID=UPI0016529ACD|nr:hypothetical protein [Seonamhaeicola marinus]